MRKNRKILAVLLTLALALSLLPTMAFAADPVEVTITAPTSAIVAQGEDTEGNKTASVKVSWEALKLPNDAAEGLVLTDFVDKISVALTIDGTAVTGSPKEVTADATSAEFETVTLAEGGKGALVATVTFTLKDPATKDITSGDPETTVTYKGVLSGTSATGNGTFTAVGGGTSDPTEYAVSATATMQQKSANDKIMVVTLAATLNPTSSTISAADLVTGGKVTLTGVASGTTAPSGNITWSNNSGTAEIAMGDLESGKYGATIADVSYKTTLPEGATVAEGATITVAAITAPTDENNYTKPTGQVTPPAAECTGVGSTCQVAVEGIHLDTCDKGCTANDSCTWSHAHKDNCPKKGTTPDPETPTITDVKYNGSKVTWIYSLDDEAAFTLAVWDPANSETPLVEAFAMTEATHEGGNWSYTYTLPTDIAKLSAYKIVVADGEISGTGTYTVPKPIDPPTSSDSTVNSALENTAGALTGVENMTPSEADAAINTITTATDTLNTDAKKESYSEALVSDATLVANIEKLEEASSVTVATSESTVSGITGSAVKVVGLALSANTSSVKLTLAPSAAARPVIPSAATASAVLTLTVSGVSNSARLSYPAVITMPIPAAVKEAAGTYYHVYHYVDGKPSWIPSTNNGTVITFATWGFSDFAIISSKTSDADPDAPSSGSNTPNKGSSSTGGGKVTVTTPSTTTPSVTVTASGFSDVPDTHTFSAEIKWAKDNGYMNGTGEGVFSPAGTVNRQQIWMVLARMAGANPANMAEALTWAVENGISDGTNPTGAVSRQQLVTMMFRFAQKQENAPSEAGADISTFSDAAQVSGYAQEALAWSVANNIVGGTADGRLNPYGNATRGAFAAILYRYYN